MGRNIATKPKIRKTLKIFEPITFHIAISDCHARAALILVTNSGSDVPIDKIVKPIIFSLKPIIVASLTACVTASCPHHTRAVSPPIIYSRTFH
jgi:hypothetical protein